MDVYGSRHSGVSGELTSLPLQGRFKAKIVQHGWTQSHCKITDRPNRVGIQPANLCQAPYKSVTTAGPHIFQVAKLDSERRHHLTHFVVQLPGQGSPLDLL